MTWDLPLRTKDDDAAVPLDVALERALATMDRLLRGDAEMQCSSRTSALRLRTVVIINILATTGRHMARRGERAGRGCFEGRTRRLTLHERERLRVERRGEDAAGAGTRFHGGSHFL